MAPDIQEPTIARLLALLEQLQAGGDDLGSTARVLAQQARELSAARAVVLFQHPSDPEQGPRVIRVVLDDYGNLAESAELRQIASVSYGLSDPAEWPPDGDDPFASLLQQAGFGRSVMLPIRLGESRLGTLLMLDLPDNREIDPIVDSLKLLAPMVALSLRNAQLVETPDVVIGERTAELENEIQELKRVEADLSEREDRYRDLVEHSHNLICSHDLDGLILSVNRSALEHLGYDQSVLLEKPNIQDFVVPRFRHQFEQYLSTVREQGEARGLMAIEASSGEERIWEFHNTLRTEGVAVPIVRGVAHDVTEQLSARRALRQRTAQLEALRKIGLELAAELDLDSLLESIIVHALELLGGEAGGIYLFRPDRDVLEWIVGIGTNPAQIGVTLERGEGLSGQVWETGQTQIVESYANWAGRAEKWGSMSNGVIAVPIQWGDEFLGVLNLVETMGGRGSFDATEVELLEQLATQAAIAIINAGLFEETDQARERNEILYHLGREIVRASQDPEQVYQAIHRATAQLMVSEAFAIALIDKQTEEVVGEYLIDRGGRWPAQRLPPGEGFSSHVIATRESILISDRLVKPPPNEAHFGEPERVRSILAVPLIIGEEVIGAVSTQSYEPDAFSAQDQMVLEMLASYAAVALENARLYAEAYRRNRELALLNQVIAVSTSGHSPTSILDTVCRELAQTLDAPRSTAAMINEQQTEAQIVAEYLAAGLPSALGDTVPVKLHPVFQALLKSREAHVFDEGRTELALPLVFEDEVIGYLQIDPRKDHPFSTEEINLAKRVVEEVSGGLTRVRMEETRRRLSAAVEQAAEAIVIADANGFVLYVNPAFEQLSGFSFSEKKSRSAEYYDGRLYWEGVFHELWDAVREADAWQVRQRHRRKDGTWFMADVTVNPVRNLGGETVNYVATMRDVTREVELEEQFHQAQKMEALGRMAGGVAHDFNNLLTVIQLSTNALERELESDDHSRTQVQRIQDAGRRANNLISQLLAFSRQEVIEPQLVNLNEVVEDLRRMLGHIVGESITISTELASDLWLVLADPTQLDQVLMNLVVNARDAMPAGGTVTLQTSNVVLDKPMAAGLVDAQAGEYVLLTVSDSGSGMEDEVKAHIFEPFFTTKGPEKGTGLGLATVYSIVKGNRGHIRVESQKGVGTSFRIYLPRIEQVGEIASVPAKQKEGAGGAETILLVEDDTGLRDVVEEILVAAGYKVLVAVDGKDALSVGEHYQGSIQLLLTDVVMPRMSGTELAEQLTAKRPEIHVLFTSGFTDESVLAESAVTGRKAFLHKPFSLDSLTHKVREMLDG